MTKAPQNSQIHMEITISKDQIVPFQQQAISKEEGETSDEETAFTSPSPSDKFEISKDAESYSPSETTTQERLIRALGNAIDLKLCDIAEQVERIEQ